MKTPATILLIDDDQDIRSVVSSALEVLGHVIVQAADGNAGLGLFRATQPDLVILDVMMPGLDGFEVLQQIRQDLANSDQYLPVLMLTARDGIADKVAGLDGGADDYLTKPFHYQELQSRITALLRTRELMLELAKKNQDLRLAQERIVQQQRQLVAFQLAGTAAHKLGQPLSAMLLNCRLLETILSEDPMVIKTVRAIVADVKRMSELIEALRTVDSNQTERYDRNESILKLKS